MYVKPLFAVIEAVLLGSALASPASPASRSVAKRQATIEDFVTKQSPIAKQGVLNNIGPDGSKVEGASAGVVIASPSKSDPDYFYTWTRDSGLVFKGLADAFIAGDDSLESYIQNYATSQAQIQKVSNPSGDLATGGLGEPKFNADTSAFTEEWGRPQRDGPPLRATALIAYGRHLVAKGQADLALKNLWPMIKNDLSYVAEYWNQTGFDLWEEVEGSSFFTIAVQHRALVEGNAFATSLEQTCEGCESQAPQARCYLQSFWNGNSITSNVGSNNGRSGLDANSILASIHTFDPEAECDDVTFQPCSARALVNLKAVVDSFRELYPINQGIEASQGVAVGRYQEDVYQGGQPWYLTTLAVAELLYQALYQWEKIGTLSITEQSLPFFKDLEAGAAEGEYASESEEYNTLTGAVKSYADSFIGVVQKYTPENGAFAEQFKRDDGSPVSATDLTWSYSSFLSAVAVRDGVVPASWGASGANELPDTCSGGSAKGTYEPPAAPEWPATGGNTIKRAWPLVSFNGTRLANATRRSYYV